MAITTKQLEVFIAFKECGTVTNAAEVLHLSQPAVSRTLERLQREAGFQILEKRGTRLVLTAAGIAFYDEVKKYYSGLVKINQVARDLATDRIGHLSVGVFAAWSNAWIASKLARFLQHREDIEVSVVVRDSRTLIDLVISQSLDMAISVYDSTHPAVKSRFLSRENLVCAVPTGHRLAAKDVIDLTNVGCVKVISLSTQDPMHQRIQEHLDRNADFSQCISVSTGATACHLVADQMGIAIVPEQSAREYQHLGYEVRPLAQNLSLPIYLITASHSAASSVAKRFIKTLTK